MKLYLAGPMRGKPKYNFPAFDAAAAKLRLLGHEIVSPAEHDREDGFDPCKDPEAKPKDLNHYMAWDLAQICHCDCVAVLTGWERSEGACIEVIVACMLGKRVVYAEGPGRMGSIGYLASWFAVCAFIQKKMAKVLL